jgi:hypothetical protein
MPLATRVRRLLCCSLTAVALAACDDDDGQPVQPLQITGNYTATTFTITTAGATRDVIADGGSISITLNGAGLTDGQLLIPPAPGQGVVVANLTGSWSLAGTTVRFDHANDTFLKQMPFEFTGSALVGDRTLSDRRYQVTLTRAGTP